MTLLSTLTPADLEELRPLFWARVDRRGPDECWPWTGDRYANGYGMLRRGRTGRGWSGLRIRASRLAIVLSGRALADDECALHRCDNPPCCNDAHLFVGSQGDNSLDRESKGRGVHRGPRGEHAPGAKLTEADVIEIRWRRAAGEKLLTLASAYGVRKNAVIEIVFRRTWSHISDEATERRNQEGSTGTRDAMEGGALAAQRRRQG